MGSTLQPGRYSGLESLQSRSPNICYNTDTAGSRAHPVPAPHLFTGQLPVNPLAPFISSNVAVFAPTKVVANPQPPRIGPTGTPRAPATARRIFLPPLIASNRTLFVPVAFKANAVLPPRIGPTGTLFAPTNVKTVKVYASFIGPTNQRFAPNIKVSAVKPPLIASNRTLFTPAFPLKVKMPFIDLHLALQTGLWDATNVFWDDSSITWDGNRVGTGVPIFPPKIGIADRKPPLIGSNRALFAPTAIVAAATNFIGPTNKLFAPLLLTYAVPPRIPSNVTLFSPSTAPSKGMPLIASAVTLFAPKPIPIASPPLISQTQVFAPGQATLTVIVGATAASIFDDPAVIFDAAGVAFDATAGASIGPTHGLFTPAVSVSGVLKPAPSIASNITLFAPATRGITLPSLIDPTSLLFAPTKITYRITAGFVGSTITIFAPTKTTAAFMPLIIDTVSLFAPLVTVPTPSTAAATVTTKAPQLKWTTSAVSLKWIVGKPQRKWRTP